MRRWSKTKLSFDEKYYTCKSHSYLFVIHLFIDIQDFWDANKEIQTPENWGKGNTVRKFTYESLRNYYFY